MRVADARVAAVPDALDCGDAAEAGVVTDAPTPQPVNCRSAIAQTSAEAAARKSGQRGTTVADDLGIESSIRKSMSTSNRPQQKRRHLSIKQRLFQGSAIQLKNLPRISRALGSCGPKLRQINQAEYLSQIHDNTRPSAGVLEFSELPAQRAQEGAQR
jgi:hypothetical protein